MSKSTKRKDKNFKRHRYKDARLEAIHQALKKIDESMRIRDAKRAINIWREVIKIDAYRINENGLKFLFDQPVIYYLIKGKDVVYVGETISLMSRMTAHYNEKSKDFDSFRFAPFNGTDFERKAKEREEILFHKPKYNVMHNKDFHGFKEEDEEAL